MDKYNVPILTEKMKMPCKRLQAAVNTDDGNEEHCLFPCDNIQGSHGSGGRCTATEPLQLTPAQEMGSGDKIFLKVNEVVFFPAAQKNVIFFFIVKGTHREKIAPPTDV